MLPFHRISGTHYIQISTAWSFLDPAFLQVFEFTENLDTRYIQSAWVYTFSLDVDDHGDDDDGDDGDDDDDDDDDDDNDDGDQCGNKDDHDHDQRAIIMIIPKMPLTPKDRRMTIVV